jgi:pyruvate dehydrogenase E2 component (dihydrolipoamide acetyltransferase)
MANELKLPALAPNVDSVEVNEVKVSAGDTVARDQPLLEVQADKAALDVTAPAAGRITEIKVKVGDKIKVGDVYGSFEPGGNGAPAAEKPARSAPKQAPVTEAPAPPKTETRAQDEAPKARPAPPPPAPTPAPAPTAGKVPPAGPATRKLARELGVDLGQVVGSGRLGRVTEDDVKAFVRQLSRGEALVPAAPGAAAPLPPLPRFEEWGPIERAPLSGIRRATARQMSLAWTTIPHVTQHDLADVTDLEAFRKEQAAKGVKLTVTAFALKACAIALKKFPEFNSSLDLGNSQLVLKRYVHIGVAVDTPKGLVVPVLRDADKKSVSALGDELTATAARARDGKLDVAEMKGGTFTITNLGGIGGTGFTPIVNYPEVAILGMSRSRWEPTVRDGKIEPRFLLPLSLSYDHRVIDGAAAARFTRFVAEMLESPLTMLLHA